jgi:hypothetical protein
MAAPAAAVITPRPSMPRCHQPGISRPLSLASNFRRARYDAAMITGQEEPDRGKNGHSPLWLSSHDQGIRSLVAVLPERTVPTVRLMLMVHREERAAVRFMIATDSPADSAVNRS